MNDPERKDTAQRAFLYVGIAVAVVIVLVLLWYAIDVFLLAFISILLAILLRAPANWLSRRTGLAPSWSLAAVGLVVIALLVGAGVLFGKAIGTQSLELSRRLPEVIESVKEQLREHEWTGFLFQLSESSGESGQGFSFVGQGMRAIGSTFGAIANILIVIFFATFLAAQPRPYIDGFVSLFPKKKRKRIHEVLDAIGHMLERWLAGQGLLMLLVALATGTGLALLGAPLAAPLGLLAGLLEFVPYFGPILAGVPAVLIAFSQSPELAMKVLLLYVFIQAALGYLVEPFVQHKAVYLPPALIIFTQILLGLIAGGLGIAVATPFAATAMVAINMLYVEDALGDESRTEPSIRST